MIMRLYMNSYLMVKESVVFLESPDSGTEISCHLADDNIKLTCDLKIVFNRHKWTIEILNWGLSKPVACCALPILSAISVAILTNIDSTSYTLRFLSKDTHSSNRLRLFPKLKFNQNRTLPRGFIYLYTSRALIKKRWRLGT